MPNGLVLREAYCSSLLTPAHPAPTPCPFGTYYRSWCGGRIAPKIGIGGRLAVPPLPHHPAYGHVPGGSNGHSAEVKGGVYDNQPGGDPHARVELFGPVQLQHPIDQRRPASRGALGVVLVRLRIAEINQNAIAHVAGDKPAKALDNRCDA